MLSDDNILLHLDEILTNEESDDEFIDDIDFGLDTESTYSFKIDFCEFL